ncbi:hypothetical protein HMPREF2572_01410 [Neisseria sp. HMSC064E01]|nr:hypothetical protein HMPREF2572_01410 [Neisseria sp. HMSC064E01]
MAILFLPLPDEERQETERLEHQLIIVKTDLPCPIYARPNLAQITECNGYRLTAHSNKTP